MFITLPTINGHMISININHITSVSPKSGAGTIVLEDKTLIGLARKFITIDLPYLEVMNLIGEVTDDIDWDNI